MSAEHSRHPRRHIIVGAGLGLITAALAACSTYGRKPALTGDPVAQANALAKTSDVPMGAGVIVGDVVLTQPSKGVFKGLSTTCPHAGCTVSEVVGATIGCPCHGGRFNLDGSVANGPATRALEARPVTVAGDSIVAG